ncbi:MAG: PorV/PorQ family protein [Elusimicrobia bacterium]|nr:PorV/PorQ family protein [Elusimicrobiota bacterium]
MKIKKYIIVYLLTFVICHLSSVICLYGAAFDPIAIGARSRGMGGAFTSVADDASAIYWNPAGLSYIKRAEAEFMYNDIYNLGLVDFTTLSYARPDTGFGSLGVGWFNYGTTREVDFLEYSENTFSISYGMKLWKWVSGGVTTKFYKASSISNGSGFGVDLGMLFEPPLPLNEMFRIGITAQNVGYTAIRWDTDAIDYIPVNVRTGICFLKKRFTLSLDCDALLGSEKLLQLGTEYWIVSDMIGCRLGASQFAANNHSWITSGGISVGVDRVRFDFAYENHTDLGPTHIFSINVGL